MKLKFNICKLKTLDLAENLIDSERQGTKRRETRCISNLIKEKLSC